QRLLRAAITSCSQRSETGIAGGSAMPQARVGRYRAGDFEASDAFPVRAKPIEIRKLDRIDQPVDVAFGDRFAGPHESLQREEGHLGVVTDQDLSVARDRMRKSSFAEPGFNFLPTVKFNFV